MDEEIQPREGILLALIEAGIMGITIGTAVIESLIDAALMGIAGI